MDHKLRAGRFTSSQIYRLLGSASVRSTYIEETRMERRLNRVLDTDFWSKATSWGYLMEILAFNELGLEYEMTTNETLTHPTLPEYWSGTPDFTAPNKVAEVKGYEFKKWVKLTDAILEAQKTDDLTVLKSLKDSRGKGKEYWQVVSNAIIAKKPKAEIITKMPYESDFELIRKFVEDIDPNKSPWMAELYEAVKWVQWADKSKLPLLPDDGYYKSLNRYEFTIPLEDITLLTATVKTDIQQLKDA